jgi:SnoaL-like protein
MNDDTNVAELFERIEALEAERDILRNLFTYGPCLDYGDPTWADCFTDDGVFEVTGPVPKRVEGRKALAEFASRHTRAPERRHKHCIFGPLVSVKGDEATSVGYFARLDDTPNGPVIHTFGRYHDELVRSTDGRWRFRRRWADVEARRNVL